ncbi:MAG: hypothetical protein ACI88A_002469 [Paraglaciecola sp.]|jgi:hypothetical protein
MFRLMLIVMISCISACGAATSRTATDPVVGSNPVHREELVGDNSPRGIFVSSGPNVSDSVLSQKHVAGNLIRVGWEQVEASPGKYDFSIIKAKIEQAKRLNKKVTLSVLNGPRAPQWLYQQGAVPFKYEFRNRFSPKGNREEVIPLPWDPVYLKYWLELIAALGNMFANESAIELVHITHSSKNGFEMHLPEQRVQGRRETINSGPWKNAGFSESRYIDSLKQITDAFLRAFPKHLVDIEIHPVLDSLHPAQSIYTYGYQRYGTRFGLLAAWWSGKPQKWNLELTKLLTQACQQSFCAIQMIGNETKHPDRLLGGSLLEAMSDARDKGAKYFEVWDIDLRNSELTPQLEQFSRSLYD